MNSKILAISSKDVLKCFPMKDAIDVMKSAFSIISNPETPIPQRTALEMKNENADALIMPVYAKSAERFAIKVAAINRDNPSKNLPLIHSVMLLFNSATGVPLAFLDAGTITAIRTGAGCGLATDILSRKNSSVAAIFGAGVQARYQLEAVCNVREIKYVQLFNIDTESSKKFIAEMSSRFNVKIEMSEDTSELKNADIICTATTALSPVFEDKDIADGTHINVIGSYKPDVRESPSLTVKRAKLVVDSKSSCLKEAGDIIIPIKEGAIKKDHIYAELGEIINGKAKPRLNDNEVTFFKSVGNAVQDLSSAMYIFNKANDLGLGEEISL
jgi:ornithine cyclodeaminase/alanine dehydrogenase-like protein (mu-crystallin family)